MIETATDEYIDPLPFFMNKVKDKTAPRAEGIMPVSYTHLDVYTRQPPTFATLPTQLRPFMERNVASQ